MTHSLASLVSRTSGRPDDIMHHHVCPAKLLKKVTLALLAIERIRIRSTVNRSIRSDLVGSTESLPAFHQIALGFPRKCPLKVSFQPKNSKPERGSSLLTIE